MPVRSTSSDTRRQSDDFAEGFVKLQRLDFEAAETCFQQVCDECDENDPNFNKYVSFLGLAAVLNSQPKGLMLCRETAALENHNADIYLNLAIAEWHYRNRSRAIDALKGGLALDSRHQGLLRVQEQLGRRVRKVIPLLPRNHVLNVYFGRSRRRPEINIPAYSLLY